MSDIPRSVTRWFDPFLNIAVVVALYAWMRDWPVVSPLVLSIFLVCGYCVFAYASEYIGSGLYKMPAAVSAASERWASVRIKWLGSAAAFALILFLWWLLPEYRGDKYQPTFEALAYCFVFLPVVVGAAIWAAERKFGPHRDATWHLGNALLGGRHASVEWSSVWDCVAVYLIKGFFLPLNFVGIVSWVARYRGHELAFLSAADWTLVYQGIMPMLYALIVATILPGYLFSSRLFGTHTRAVDRSWFGWAVTLACYAPLNIAVGGHWFSYTTKESGFLPWIYWTGDSLSLAYVIGGMIILSECMHLWGEAIFGIRASNLTNRGVITNGPFRITKHPVYVAKCIGWFLIYLPFLSSAMPFKASLLFISWCSVYVMRAWAEERMLSKDPDYVAYARAMDGKGWLRFLTKTPLFRYEWRYARWQRAGLV